MDAKPCSGQASSQDQPGKRRVVRTLIAGALSVGLLSVPASSADAATISPTSADLGRVVVNRAGPPVTFTVTKAPNESRFAIHPDPFCNCFTVNGSETTGINDVTPRAPGTCASTSALTAGNPSCTITVDLEPTAYGFIFGGVGPNYDLIEATADLKGVGLLSRKNPNCRKGVHSKLKRWCQRRGK